MLSIMTGEAGRNHLLLSNKPAVTGTGAQRAAMTFKISVIWDVSPISYQLA